jgi:hypothetical protein
MSHRFSVRGFTGRDIVLTVDLQIEDDRSSLEVIGLLPDIVDADFKENFRERFEAVMPNDGQTAVWMYVHLG